VKHRILIVEDNPITRKMMRFALESEGYEVLEAGDGKTALEIANDGRPVSLILQDYVLPDTDGMALIEAFRKFPALASVPILVITGMVSRLEEMRASESDAVTFLAKPMEPSRLLEAVRVHLSGGVQAKELGSRVLVVDDELLGRKLATMRLRDAGYTTDSAADGKEAVAKAREWQPDAILSDVLMPGMDGFLLAAAVRGDPALRHIPIVLLSSSYVEEADHELARRLGANGLVVRTPDFGDALRALAKALRDGAPRGPGEQPGTLHQQRIALQLEKQLDRNEALLREAAIQAAALSVVRGLAEVLTRPHDASSVLGDVLVHCLDAAGLSSGLLYVVQPEGTLALRGQAGVPVEVRGAADAALGASEALLEVLNSGKPASHSSNAPSDLTALRVLAARLGQKSVLIIPFVVIGRRHGVMVLGSNTHDLSSRPWRGFANTLSAQFGQTLALGETLSRLALSESRYRGLLQHANDAICILSEEGVVIEANGQMATLMAMPRDRLVGLHISDMSPSHEVEAENLRLFEGILRAQGGRVDGVVLRRGDGSHVEVDFSVSIEIVDEKPHVLAIGRDVTERNRAAAALEEAQLRMQHLVTSSPAILHSFRVEGMALVPTWTSANVERLLGYTPEEALDVGWWDLHIHPEDRDRVLAEKAVLFHSGHLVEDYRFAHKQGDYRQIHAELRLIHPSADAPMEVVATWSDVTERVALEAQLYQAQKMEGIGQLAGGIAHDFNNLLGVISGYATLLARDLGSLHPGAKRVEHIRRAAERAAELTRQLLAFSRKQVLQPQVLDLNAVVSGVEPMLKRLIGEHVQLVTSLGRDLGLVKADPGQLEQVILNLSVNARDAMPEGGSLVLETSNANLDEAHARKHPDVTPGPYVLLAATDTGHGMDAATVAHIFEPFFTTKPEGKGTGLGLSTVFGIVKQSGGHVEVQSEMGLGTSFKVYLPRVSGKVVAEHPPSMASGPRGSGTILLVEDENSLRQMIAEILREAGYKVLLFADPEEAVNAAALHDGPISAILTDVVMPGMNGHQLADRICEGRPETRVIYMSGYTDDSIGQHGVLEPGTHYIQKPFTAVALQEMLRAVLEEPTGSTDGGRG
jgi:PAS domain S-box-containing protein